MGRIALLAPPLVLLAVLGFGALAVVVDAIPMAAMNSSIDASGGMPKWPTLYEISTRPWLYSLSQKYGRSITKLNDIPDADLQEIADMHVDVVWFMGVWQLGAAGLEHDRTNPNLFKSYDANLPGWTKEDVIGSPYAITDYTVNSDIGTEADLAHLRSRLNALGMKLCVDFVPNHSALDAPFATTNPDWYIRQPAGESFDSSRYYMVNNIPLAYGHDIYSGAWTDTLQWNYWSTDLRAHMTSMLVKIASVADAVRCDMAQNELSAVYDKAWGDVLTKDGFSAPGEEFWSAAISAARKANPNFVVMAEAYVYGITATPEDELLQQLGFTFTYDKNLLDDLHNGQSIPNYIMGRGANYFSKAAQFLSNHDEPRAIPTLGGVVQSEIGAVLVYTLPGLRLFWWGQWDGFTAKLDVHLRREVSEASKPDVHAFYSTLLSIIKHKVFQSGKWEYVSFSGTSSIIGWRWSDSDGNKRLVAINYSSNANQYGEAVLPDASCSSGDDLEITDLLDGTKYTRSVSEMKSSGLKVLLQPWHAQIFDYTDN